MLAPDDEAAQIARAVGALAELGMVLEQSVSPVERLLIQKAAEMAVCGTATLSEEEARAALEAMEATDART